MIHFDGKVLVYDCNDWIVKKEYDLEEIFYQDSGVIAKTSYRGVVFLDGLLGIKFTNEKGVFPKEGVLEEIESSKMTKAVKVLAFGSNKHIRCGDNTIILTETGFIVDKGVFERNPLFVGDEVTTDYRGPVCCSKTLGLKYGPTEYIWIKGKTKLDFDFDGPKGIVRRLYDIHR